MAWGWTIGWGSFALIRASLVRALTASAVLAGALSLAGCYGDDGYQLPTRAMKELSPEMLTLLDQKNMPKDSPLLVRIFKEESELEIWKQDSTARYELLKVYPICRWSGGIGPKVKEGDRQAPEGFYPISPGLMNPNSQYYLAINTGFPNAFDKANGYSGAFLMIHGDCSSRGCYAMTDEQIGEIYSLAREAFLGGQKAFQVQAYPFRMTAANLARHRDNPNMAFWKMIKVGNDHFEVSHQEPKVDVCEKHYVFDAVPPAGSTKPLAFSPSGRCPVYETDPNVAEQAMAKQKNDDYQFAQMQNVATVPIETGTDGGMNRVFMSRLENPTYSYDNEGHLHSASFLVQRRYSWRGYQISLPSSRHANRITLSAYDRDDIVATISIGLDSRNGLFVDGLFARELKSLRAPHRRVCEFTRLAIDESLKSKPVIAALFHSAYIYARRIRSCTDLLVEVNPRHVRFYERMLGFRALGPIRDDPRVQAPAALLHLDLGHAEAEISKYGGKVDQAASIRSLYPFFFSPSDEARIELRLRAFD